VAENSVHEMRVMVTARRAGSSSEERSRGMQTEKKPASKPVAVLISDIHFTPATLELASSALRQARDMAWAFSVPLVLAGDTLDTKAIIRGECANRLIEILSAAPAPRSIVLVGNHDLLNEKGKAHSLNFLAPYSDIIQHPVYDEELESWLIPYQHSPGELQITLNGIKAGSRLIMHQGVQGADLGHYVQDKTSLPKEAFSRFRVISGHYHRAQDIMCGPPGKRMVGTFTYIGNPYTLSFGEAGHGEKGFRILYADGTLGFVPTNLRKHVIIETTVEELDEADEHGAEPFAIPAKEDLIWIKVRGTHGDLSLLKKAHLAKTLGRTDFKMDKIYTDAPKLETKSDSLTGEQLLDAIIDNTDDTDEQKAHLKALAREVLA
jgi:hypothetical protein